MNQSDPHLIKPYELETATVSERLEYLVAYEKARENDLREAQFAFEMKKERREKIRQIIATALIISGTLGASVIGSYSLYDQGKASSGNSQIESMLRIVENIERNVIETHKAVKTDHKLVNAVVFKVNKLHCKEFPDQCLNAFGHYNKKGK